MASAASAATISATNGGPSPVSYSCNLSNYGQSLPLTAMLAAHSTGSQIAVTLQTQPMQLPTAAATAFHQLNYLDAAANAPMSGMPGTSASLSGQSQTAGTASGGLSELPSVMTTGTVPMSAMSSGAMATVQAPPMLTLTPVGANPEPSFTCTRSSTVQVQVQVASTGATTGAGGTGQSYTCTITVGTSTTTSQVPMRWAASQHMVTLSAPVSAFGNSFPSTAAMMSVSGAATLSGANAGNVPMTGLTDSGNGSLMLSGHWSPNRAGMTNVYAPYRFRARLQAQTATAVTVVCVAVAPTTTSTQVMTATQVQVSASPSAMATSAAMASAPAATPASAAPTGAAPNTGGGGSLLAADELPLAAGGGVAVLAGLALTGYALKRGRASR